MSAPAATRLVGLVSDTHGRLDPRVAIALAGCTRILHAGDVGRSEVLWELRVVAPVDAVQGNVDRWEMAHDALPERLVVDIEGFRITIVHESSNISAEDSTTSDVIVFGHSHRPIVERRRDVLWVNPGSASQPRGAALGRSVALLQLSAGEPPTAQIISLDDVGESE